MKIAFQLLALCSLAALGACAQRTAAHAQVAPAEQSAPELPGSTDGSRVALDTRGGELGVKFLIGRAGAEDLQALQAVAPNVEVVAGLSAAEALERAAEFEGADARYATPEFLAAASGLRWLQSMSAGVDRYVGVAGLAERPEIVLTNMAGIHGPAIADHAFALLLALTRDLRPVLDSARGPSWRVAEGPLAPSALQGRTLFVVGLGGIGNEVARRGHGFGMRVVATRRTASPAPAWVDELGTSQAFERFLPQADVIAICLPLTDETRDLFDAAAFARVKPGAILINVGRGAIVDTDALLVALESGRLAGACLDVTNPEPLPSDHPLWALPQVIITPHSSSQAVLTGERSDALLSESFGPEQTSVREALTKRGLERLPAAATRRDQPLKDPKPRLTTAAICKQNRVTLKF